GQPEPEVFPGGPSDKTVLYDYRAPHIARCVYDDKDCEMIMPVSNGGKMTKVTRDVYELDWWPATMEATGMIGLDQTGYSFLDPALLSTFVEKWHGETSSFHMPSGEMTVRWMTCAVFCISPLRDVC
ncbi:serine/threonine-protein phosphatase 7 long form-like protein, partial [Trifolium medium]|nr:serine/threonine-protein phosphatase 7 long form-like protein [Trifolium medium]